MTSLAGSVIGARREAKNGVLDRMVWLAVAVLPITGLSGIGAFGELKGSATVYVLAAAILVAVFTTPPREVLIPRPLFVFVAFLLVWLVVTTAINFDGILTSVYHGRSGFNKFATSSAVLIFGIASALVCARPFRRVNDVEQLFVNPLVVAVVACAVFAVPEILSWFSSAGEFLYKISTGLLHTADDEEGRVAGRLISLAFEAPDLSYFCGFACPWMLLAYRLRAGNRPLLSAPILAGLPLLLCLITLLLSNSRTGLLMLGGLVFAEFVYWIGMRGLRLGVLAAVAAVPVFAAVVVVPWLALHEVDATLAAGDVSTTSRLALFSAQTSIFANNPVFGVGFGQFGFHAYPVLPSWAWDSYEVVNWFETFDDLPPTFNVAGRLGAELGAPGLVIWYGFWVMAIIRIARAAIRLPRGSSLNFLNAALLGSIFSLILGGMSNDPFRRPETWLLIAITALHAGRTSEQPV
ncbi:MAG TPA: O-antigen ligase family protein [Bradyrhizobium sp.]|nr:O-antigen ligase family protein [Bradyrhizobium sp.]